MYISCKDGLARHVEELGGDVKIYRPKNLTLQKIGKILTFKVTASCYKIACKKTEYVLPDCVSVLTEEGFKKVGKLEWNDKLRFSSIAGIPLKTPETYTNLAYARLSGYFQNKKMPDRNKKVEKDLTLFRETSQFFEFPNLDTFSLSMKKEFLAAFFSGFDLEESLSMSYKTAADMIIEAEKINSCINEIGLESKLKIDIVDDGEKLDIEYILDFKQLMEKVGIRYNDQKSSEMFLGLQESGDLNVDKTNYTYSLPLQLFPVILTPTEFILPKGIFVLNGLICKF